MTHLAILIKYMDRGRERETDQPSHCSVKITMIRTYAIVQINVLIRCHLAILFGEKRSSTSYLE